MCPLADELISFVLTDLSLAHALRQRLWRPDEPVPDIVLGYDINCAYCIKAVDRSENLPDVAHLVGLMRRVIPECHVKNHIQKCEIQYGPSYIVCIGHFHAETAEHYWPECNQVGAYTRQMNGGHRHDTIIDHHSDWNFKKMINMCMLLYRYANNFFLTVRPS